MKRFNNALEARIGAALCRLALLAELAADLTGCQSVRIAYNGREFDDAATITLKEYVDSLRKAATQKPTEEERDGFHFVYNPYEIACGATGAVEVVINPKTL